MRSHLEAAANTVAGLAIGYVILLLFGVPPGKSASLQGTFFVVSYARAYVIRRLFARKEK